MSAQSDAVCQVGLEAARDAHPSQTASSGRGGATARIFSPPAAANDDDAAEDDEDDDDDDDDDAAFPVSTVAATPSVCSTAATSVASRSGKSCIQW